eukprot:NODE_18_length_40692_cov_0.469183.p4 type:complete len:694 gc:universal NODE_18_length_40692_cov_0.469183:22934-25015(+)
MTSNRGLTIKPGNTFRSSGQTMSLKSTVMYYGENRLLDCNFEFHNMKLIVTCKDRSYEFINAKYALLETGKLLVKCESPDFYLGYNKLRNDAEFNIPVEMDGNHFHLSDTLAIEYKLGSTIRLIKSYCNDSAIRVSECHGRTLSNIFNTYRGFIKKAGALLISDSRSTQTVDSHVFYGQAKVNKNELSNKKRKITGSIQPSNQSTTTIDMTTDDQDLPFFNSSPKIPRSNRSEIKVLKDGYSFEGSRSEPESLHKTPKKKEKSISPILSRKSKLEFKARHKETSPLLSKETAKSHNFIVSGKSDGNTNKNSKTEIPSNPASTGTKKESKVVRNAFNDTPIRSNQAKKNTQPDSPANFLSDQEFNELCYSTTDKDKSGTYSHSKLECLRERRQSFRNAKKESLMYIPKMQNVTLPKFLNHYAENDIICEENGITLKKSDATRLNTGEFLNDQILHYFFAYYKTALGSRRIHVFSTFFFFKLKQLIKNKQDLGSLRRWTKNIDIISYPIIIVPINESYHWYFAIITNLQLLQNKVLEPGYNDIKYEHSNEKPCQIVIVDSLHKNARPNVKSALLKYMSEMLHLQVDEIRNHVGMKMGHSPLQENGCDCGLFVIYTVMKLLENDELINKIANDKQDWWDNEIIERQQLLSLIDDHHHEYKKRSKDNQVEICESDEIIFIEESKITDKEEDNTQLTM